MLLKENILLAIAGLKANKMRSFLTMLGIIIGIASVIAIMTVGDAVNNSVTSSMGDIGANNIDVGIGLKPMDNYDNIPSMEEKDYINEEKLTNLLKQFSDEIEAFSLNVSAGSGKASEEKRSAKVKIVGANGGYLQTKNMKLLHGRSFSRKDQDNGKKVAIVSDKFVEKMFPGNPAEALGQLVDISQNDSYYSYIIVGIYEYSQSNYGFAKSSTEDIETDLYIPIKAAIQQNHGTENYDYFTIIGKVGIDSQKLANDVATYMNNRYFKESEYYEITTYSMEAMLSEMTSMISTIKLAISGIAGISLLVGGIGVMNIMIVSITERTREIGTRKALGATNGSIRLQFITEAVVICLIGGIIGVLLGIVAGMGIVKLMGYVGSASVGSIFFCVGFSMAFGIFFGYYPASRAAKLNPIEALRYE